MKKVLLTGSTGFIGAQVTTELLKREYEVHALVYPPFAAEQPNLVQHEMNLLDSKAVDEFLSQHNFENLIHLAWYVGPKCQTSPLNLDWLTASINLIKSFQKNGGKKILATGSMSEYDFSYGWCKENNTPLKSLSLYGQSKAALFEVITKFATYHNMSFTWLRLFNLYGPNEKSARLMPYVINTMLKNEDVKVSTCTQIQNYLHVKDAAKAIVQCFEKDVQGDINICSDKPIQLREIVEKIAEYTDFKGQILWGAIPASFEQQFVSGDNTRLTKEVGWKQEISLEDGLKDTINWWRSNNV